MKVKVELLVEVDVPAWELTYGVPRTKMRDDVKQYALQQLQGSAAADERCITDVALVNA